MIEKKISAVKKFASFKVRENTQEFDLFIQKDRSKGIDMDFSNKSSINRKTAVDRDSFHVYS